MDSLKHLIKTMYGELADSEVILAEGNLLGFFRKLEAIDERLSQECSVNPNEICNEFNHENIRS
jgi:hypothetical protein